MHKLREENAEEVCNVVTLATKSAVNIPGLAIEGADGDGAKKKSRRRRNRGKNKANKPSDTGDGASEATEDVASSVVGTSNLTGTSLIHRIPKAKKRRIFRKFLLDHSQIFDKHPIAFDGVKNGYSASDIPQLKTKFSSNIDFDDDGRQKKYKVTIVSVGKEMLLRDLLKSANGGLQQRLEKADIFQALEVMFNSGRCLKYDLVGQNRFFSPKNEFDPSYGMGGGIEGRVGFYASFRAIQWKDAGKLALNVDIAHAGFYKDLPLLEFLEENGCFKLCELKNNELQSTALKKITHLLVDNMIKVQPTHNRRYTRPYTVKSVGPETAFHQFEDRNNRKISVKNHFQNMYRVSLEYPQLPCLKVGAQANTLLPMEVMKVVAGQRIKGRLTESQTTAFIRQAAVRPSERRKQIDSIVRVNKFHEDCVLRSVGLQVDLKPIEVKGRVLPPPSVVMRQRSEEAEVPVIDGVWNTKNFCYKKTASLDNWALINFSWSMKRANKVNGSPHLGWPRHASQLLLNW